MLTEYFSHGQVARLTWLTHLAKIWPEVSFQGQKAYVFLGKICYVLTLTSWVLPQQVTKCVTTIYAQVTLSKKKTDWWILFDSLLGMRY